MLRHNIFFLMARHIFSFLAAGAICFFVQKTLEPRLKFACRSKILQNQTFIFVADPYYNRSGAALTPPVRPNKKGAVSRLLLICKLFVNFLSMNDQPVFEQNHSNKEPVSQTPPLCKLFEIIVCLSIT